MHNKLCIEQLTTNSHYIRLFRAKWEKLEAQKFIWPIPRLKLESKTQMKTAKQRQDRTGKYRYFTLSKYKQTCRIPWSLLILGLIWVRLRLIQCRLEAQKSDWSLLLLSCVLCSLLYLMITPLPASLHSEMFMVEWVGALSNVDKCKVCLPIAGWSETGLLKVPSNTGPSLSLRQR